MGIQWIPAEYKRALELDPNDASGHQWVRERSGQDWGREQEALAEINRAHQLDPLSPIISKQIGDIHIMSRHYDEAIAGCKKLADENPTFAPAYDCLIYVDLCVLADVPPGHRSMEGPWRVARRQIRV